MGLRNNRYIVSDKETSSTKVFNMLKDAAEYVGLHPSSLRDYIKNRTSINGRWIIRKETPPFEMELLLPRHEGVNYRKLRKNIQGLISKEHTEGIVFLNEKAHGNKVYWDIHIKYPSKELITTIKNQLKNDSNFKTDNTECFE